MSRMEAQFTPKQELSKAEDIVLDKKEAGGDRRTQKERVEEIVRTFKETSENEPMRMAKVLGIEKDDLVEILKNTHVGRVLSKLSKAAKKAGKIYLAASATFGPAYGGQQQDVEQIDASEVATYQVGSEFAQAGKGEAGIEVEDSAEDILSAEVMQTIERGIEMEKTERYSFIRTDEFKALDDEAKGYFLNQIIDTGTESEGLNYGMITLIFLKKIRGYSGIEELLTKAVKIEPDQALDFFDNFKDEEYAARIVRTALENCDPAEAYKDIRELDISEEQKKEFELFVSSLHESPTLDEIQKKFEADKRSSDFFRGDYWLAIDVQKKGDYLQQFIREEECDNDIISALFSQASYIKNHPQAREIITAIIEKDPPSGVLNFHNYEDYVGSDEMLRFALDNVLPHHVASKFERYAHVPWAEEYAHTTLSEKAPELFLSFKKQFDRFDWYESEVRNAVVGRQREFLAHLEEFKGQYDWVEKMSKIAVEINIGAAIEFYRHYSDYGWAEEKLKTAVDKAVSMGESGGTQVLKFSQPFRHFSWFESAVKRAVDISPRAAVKYFPTYQEYAWAEGKLRDSVNEAPNEVFSEFKHLKSFSWAEGVLVESAKSADLRTIEGFLNSQYGQALSPELRTKISDAIPEIAELAEHVLDRSHLEDGRDTYEPIKLREDRAIEAVSDIRPAWIPDEHIDKSDERSLAQYRLILARNLYFQGVTDVTEEAVRTESFRTMKARERFGGTKLFSGRPTLLAAHGEHIIPMYRKKGQKDINRFGKQAVQEEIVKQQRSGIQQGEKAPEFAFFRPDDTEESVLKVKQDTLAWIKGQKHPSFTVVFDGHGGENGFFFSDGWIRNGGGVEGESETSNNISPRELADALIEQHQNLQGESEGVPIFVFSACYSTNYLRKLYDILEESGIPKPIAIGISEYGQTGDDDFKSPYGCKFLERTILQIDRNGTATIQGVIEQDDVQESSNPSLYIPDSENRPQQLSKQIQGGSDEVVV